MAHEFFDAMPVNLFEVSVLTHCGQLEAANDQKRGNAFEEVMVDIDPAYDPLSAAFPYHHLKLNNQNANNGKIPIPTSPFS